MPTSNGFSYENQDSEDDDDNEKTEVAENQPQSQISEEREAPFIPTKRVRIFAKIYVTPPCLKQNQSTNEFQI